VEGGVQVVDERVAQAAELQRRGVALDRGLDAAAGAHRRRPGSRQLVDDVGEDRVDDRQPRADRIGSAHVLVDLRQLVVLGHGGRGGRRIVADAVDPLARADAPLRLEQPLGRLLDGRRRVAELALEGHPHGDDYRPAIDSSMSSVRSMTWKKRALAS
jgi:hypothetical protein